MSSKIKESKESNCVWSNKLHPKHRFIWGLEVTNVFLMFRLQQEPITLHTNTHSDTLHLEASQNNLQCLHSSVSVRPLARLRVAEVKTLRAESQTPFTAVIRVNMSNWFRSLM